MFLVFLLSLGGLLISVCQKRSRKESVELVTYLLSFKLYRAYLTAGHYVQPLTYVVVNKTTECRVRFPLNSLRNNSSAGLRIVNNKSLSNLDSAIISLLCYLVSLYISIQYSLYYSSKYAVNVRYIAHDKSCVVCVVMLLISKKFFVFGEKLVFYTLY